jgi:hypothetical protein
MLLSGAADYFLECGNVDWGDNAKDCAVDCLIGMLPIPNPCGKFGQWFGMAAGAAGAAAGGLNSFSAGTLVHVMPQGAAEHDAQQAQAELRPIGQLKPGDQVLAIAEWKDKGQARNEAGDALDARLSYEKVTDVYTSRKEQVLVHLTLDNGDQLTATEGHPFKTSEGWRDAILLKRGGKLLLKGSGESGSDKTALIADVRVEKTTVQVFNLEVANAHTFFVGKDGVVVHNARSRTSGENDAARDGRRIHETFPAPPGSERNVRLPGSNRRADFVDFKNKIIYELKPCNKRQKKRGEKQVKEYTDIANNATDDVWGGGGWTGEVITY